MNQIANPKNTTALTQPVDNPFEAYGEAVSQRSIVGKLLKFSKGDYLVGENNDEMEEGTELIANMDELMVGWIRWQDNKPSEQIMGRVAKSFQPPKRHELGDNDKEAWEVDDQGEPRDPWQLSNYLLMKEPGGEELYTFTTASRGGLNAIGELCKAYGKAMRQRPDEFPIVILKVGSYQHSNKAYGRIKYPIFEISGWAAKAEFEQALAAENTTANEEEEGARKAVNETDPPKPASKPRSVAAKKPAAAETRF